MVKLKVYEQMARQGFLTRRQLAEATGINPSNLGKIVRGNIEMIRFSTINALCKALKCNVQDLIEYIPDEET